MSTDATHIKTCTESLKLLGDFWTLRIIEVLSQGEYRYCVLQREVGNLNPATLTKKLHKLEQTGLVIRNVETNSGAVSYALTKRGESALPVLRAIQRFSSATSASELSTS